MVPPLRILATYLFETIKKSVCFTKIVALVLPKSREMIKKTMKALSFTMLIFPSQVNCLTLYNIRKYFDTDMREISFNICFKILPTSNL